MKLVAPTTHLQGTCLIITFLVGFGFLSFEDEDSVDRCVSEHFVNLNGKQVIISFVIVFGLLFKT